MRKNSQKSKKKNLHVSIYLNYCVNWNVTDDISDLGLYLIQCRSNTFSYNKQKNCAKKSEINLNTFKVNTTTTTKNIAR